MGEVTMWDIFSDVQKSIVYLPSTRFFRCRLLFRFYGNYIILTFLIWSARYMMKPIFNVLVEDSEIRYRRIWECE